MSSATTTWGEGEYELMARCLAPASEALVDALNVHAEDSVIDLACGTGNVAVLAAQRGASVLGVDFEPRLIDLARDRIDSERARWLCADVAGLDLGGERFLVVVSAFGVMYVPDHREAALTLRRCGVRGARVGLAAWMPGGFMERMGAVLAPYLPAPLSSSGPPSAWGDPASVVAILAPAGIEVSTSARSEVVLRFADVTETADILIRSAGHVARERSRLQADGRWASLEREVCDLVQTSNQPDGEPGVRIVLDYLLVIGSLTNGDLNG